MCFFTVVSANLTPGTRRGFELLFPSIAATYHRYAIAVPGAVSEISRDLPEFNQKLATPMELWRRAIVALYEEYEQDYPIRLKPFSSEYLNEVHKETSERIEAALIALESTGHQTERVKRTW